MRPRGGRGWWGHGVLVRGVWWWGDWVGLGGGGGWVSHTVDFCGCCGVHTAILPFFCRGAVPCLSSLLPPCSSFPAPSIPVPLLACLLHLYKIVGNVQMGSSNKFCTISVQQRWRQDSGERGGEDMPWVVLYWLEN